VYFARPDSIIDNIPCTRRGCAWASALAEKIKRERPDHDIDVVIPIPDTSRTSAVQVAQLLGVKYREGFIKIATIGRTFIMPGQEQRSKSVRSKLNAIDLEFRGKNVLLVDDSIVARHHVRADHRHGARSGSQESVFRLGCAAGPLSQCLRHRHAGCVRVVAAGHTDDEVRTSSAPIG